MATGRESSRFPRWLYLGLGAAAVAAAIWLAWSLRESREHGAALQPSADVAVRRREEYLAFLPAARSRQTALVFISGSQVDAEAYAVMLRPVAAAGHPVFVLRLPYQRAFLHVQQPIVFERVKRVIAEHPQATKWVLSGHSLGAALAVLFTQAEPDAVAGLALVASNYPHDIDLTGLRIPVSQIYATEDGMNGPAKALAASRLLPPHTRRIEIAGGNHAQFGRYPEAAFDGEATIPRERQEAETRGEIIRLLAEVEARR